MLIREAVESDAMGIAQVVKQISEVQSVAGVTTEDIRDRIARGLSLVARSETSTVLVGAGDDGAIAGYCAVHWVPFLFLSGGEAYITELFVRPSDRSYGLGSLLLREVENRSRQRGCSRLSLLNSRDRESYKRGFYTKRNWVERGQMANFILPISNLPNKSLQPAATAPEF
jgi:ribosomal protein S18 acetylase RimI-like enzyme